MRPHVELDLAAWWNTRCLKSEAVASVKAVTVWLEATVVAVASRWGLGPGKGAVHPSQSVHLSSHCHQYPQAL